MSRHPRAILRVSGRFDRRERMSIAVCESCRFFKKRDGLCTVEWQCITAMGSCPLDRQ